MSLLRLQEHPGKHMIVGYNRVRRSPMYQTFYEVECFVRDLENQTAPYFSVWIPMTEYAHHPVGSILGRRQTKLVDPARTVRARKHRFGPDAETFDLIRPMAGLLKQPTEPFLVAYPGKCRLYRDVLCDDTIGVHPHELLRFYLASCSTMIDQMLATPATDLPLAELFVDTQESGEDEAGRYVLAPKREFLSKARLRQLIIFITDPEVWSFVHFSLAAIKQRAMRDDIVAPSLYVPGPRLRLTTLRESVYDQADERRSRPIDVVRTILSDHRKPRFSEIIIKLPIMEHGELPELEGLLPPGSENEDADENQQVTSGTLVVGRVRPGRLDFKITALGSDFFAAFPAWRKVRIRFERMPRTSSTKQQSLKLSPPTDADEASTLPPTSHGNLRRLLFVPMSEPDPPREEPMREAGDFLPLDAEDLNPVVLPMASLKSKMQNFVDAGRRLAQFQAPFLEHLTPASLDEALLFALPTAWRGLARLTPEAFPRLISAVPLQFDHGVVWAVEIGRHREESEHLAVGLAAPLVHDDPLQFLARLMKAVCLRSANLRGDDPRGTWPYAYYNDVRLGRITHTYNRVRHPVNMAHSIYGRARNLLAPDHNP